MWMPSLPSRGAWIEMTALHRAGPSRARSLPSRGAWIEIVTYLTRKRGYSSRSPHGERGLKCL